MRGIIIFIKTQKWSTCPPLLNIYNFCPTLRSCPHLTGTYSVHVHHTAIRTFKHLSSSVVRRQFPGLWPQGCSRPWPPPGSISHLWLSCKWTNLNHQSCYSEKYTHVHQIKINQFFRKLYSFANDTSMSINLIFQSFH